MKDDKNADNFEGQSPDDLHFENELLKLKLQAEFGAAPVVVDGLPAEVENFFLKNIFRIERAHSKRHTISIFDKLGKPHTVKAAELSDVAIEVAQIGLEDLLIKNGVFATFCEYESSRNKYIFITEKLFNFQVEDFENPDVTIHFDCTHLGLDDDGEDQ